jgi:UDP-2,3-diacylglucosamine pyrophosphatase LpxH
MIIVVSDVHLGYEKSNKNDFLRFLEECDSKNIEHFVLLGDILDLWRRNNVEIVKENAEILSKIANLNAQNKYYIIGNHDYYLLKLNERYEKNYPFVISKSLRLMDGESNFYFMHGYELEVMANLEPLKIESYEEFSENMCFAEDRTGWILDNVWDAFEKIKAVKDKFVMMKKNPQERIDIDKIYDFAVSEAAYILLGKKPDEKFVFGHTHRPFITKNGNVANTGSWVDELSRNFQNSYVEISNGEMKLKFFK